MRGRIGIEVVAHEDQVEPTALGGARDLLDAVEILEAVHRAGKAPARDMAAGAQDEQAEMHLAGGVAIPLFQLAFPGLRVGPWKALRRGRE